jgi:hypothetical protein
MRESLITIESLRAEATGIDPLLTGYLFKLQIQARAGRDR